MLPACSYTICLVFCYTSWRSWGCLLVFCSYTISGTNILTRCHSASSLFSAIFVFHKSYTGNILGIGRNKSRTSYYLPKLLEVQREDRGGPRAGHTIGRPPWSTSDAAPSPIKAPRREKPKHPINFLETHRDPPPSSIRDREGLEALPGTLPERGIATGGLLHRHACLRRDE
jgi:hypothetical protein